MVARTERGESVVNKRIFYAVLAVLAFAAPAAAEPILAQAFGQGVLPPYEIATIIRSAGLDPLVRPLRRGAYYVLHAIGRDGREMRVVVRARSGEIVSVTPVMAAAAPRTPPRAMTRGPYEPVPPGNVPPGPTDLYETEPPEPYEGEPRMIYEAGPPVIYGPPARIPDAPPRTRAVAPPSDHADVATGSVPRVITAIEPDRDGLLPPPPQRFPNRAPAAAAKPKPAKRAVAALPKQPPLPKPRPVSDAGTSSAPAAQESASAATSVPH